MLNDEKACLRTLNKQNRPIKFNKIETEAATEASAYLISLAFSTIPKVRENVALSNHEFR